MNKSWKKTKTQEIYVLSNPKMFDQIYIFFKKRG